MKALWSLLLVACASSPRAVVFKNEPPVTSVADQRDIPKPAARPLPMMLYYLDVFAGDRIDRALSLPEEHRARDINALDEVPDSSWFTNREPQVTEQSAPPAGPWTVLGTKIGGHSPGLLVADARGDRYLMKFDVAGSPDMETGADVIVQRLLCALGYNTPEDAIVIVRRDELALAATARVEDVFGHKRPMRAGDLDTLLGGVDRRPDGNYRALVSKFLAGAPLGGYSRTGVRDDDPNDRIAHEDRRSIRAQAVFFAWLDHTDVKEDNSLDMWVADGDRHYVKHYLVDFGNALGVYGWGQVIASDGYTPTIDVQTAALGLVSVGLWKRPWEGADGERLRGVGRFEVDHYDPFGWADRYPYAPFERLDVADGFWAAKTLIRFTPAQIRAAVEAAHYADPRATEYVTSTLIARQRATARAWFERVSPLDRFELPSDARLCFDDLLLVHFADGRHTRYRARAFDAAGAPLEWHATAEGGAQACVAGLPAGDYIVVELVAERDGAGAPPVRAHIARDPSTGLRRVIGIRRS